MRSTLGWIATIGLGVGIVSLALAWAIGGRDLKRMIAEDRLGWRACDDSTVAASGPERRLPWTGDDTIDVVMPVSLRLTPAAGDEVVLRGAPEAIAHVQLRRGRLFTNCRRLGSSQPIEVELPARALRHVRISGAGTVALEKLDQPRLALTISGSGQIQAQGAVERVSATISGSGDVRLGDLATKQLTTKISGSGSLEAAPKDEADITLSGSGRVKLLSRPASLHTKVSGSGRITQPTVESADKK